ncbi:unnamed protein product [Phaedon cochleariae]|uniref:Uncharacterized protein n=1 Tax=Phaedon cochleariae TaxID=80249 RepID=A0A9P0DGG8_PHACE|nr:unnamed protein product [Phaedon cochleariae]
MEQKPKIDPGWNDPPMLNYTAMNPPPKTRITNKRVAFPISDGNSTIKSNLLSSSSPPSMPPLATLPTSILHSETTKENICKFLKNEEAKQNFSEIWETGKFSEECKCDIESLARAMIEQDLVTVRNIKDKLILQSNDLCGQWLNDINL